MQPTPVSLPEKSHGQRSLVGYSPWGRKESGTTEQLTLTYLNDGRGNEDNGDLLQKVPSMHCYTQCPQPCSRPPLTQHLHRRLLDTHRQVWVGLLWGHCYFLLGPGVHKVLFVPSKSLFPQSCVSSGSSVMGLMVTFSKRAYAGPRSAPTRTPVPVAVHC